MPDLSLASARGRLVLAVTVVGSGMAFLDSTVVNVALPAIGRDLGAEVSGLQWIVNGYMVPLAALILLGGSLGDRLGRRRIYVAGVVWFGIASVLCALAPDVRTLIAARVLQGVGGALLTPGSLAILEASFRQEERAKAIGAWAGLTGVTAAVGPFVGGSLVDAGSWRAIFLLNVPLALLILVFAARVVPETRDPEAAPRFDVAGVVTGAVGLGALTYGLIAAGDRALGEPAVWGSALLGLLALVVFVVVERASRYPLVPGTLFTSTQFTAANVVTALVYAALGASLFLLIVYLQQVLGYSAVAAGASVLPVTGLMLLFSAKSGELAQRIGPRLQMTIGPLVMAAAFLLLWSVDAGDSYVVGVLPGVLVLGIGLTAMVAPLTATVLAAAEERHAGIASGVNNTVARAGQLFAVALIPVAAGITGDAYLDPELFTEGYRRAMLISAVIVAAGGVISFAGIRRLRPGEVPTTPPRPAEAARYECAVDGPPMRSCPHCASVIPLDSHES